MLRPTRIRVEWTVDSVLGISGDTMVLLNQRVKDNSEVLVRVPVTSVDAAVLVIELNSAGNSLGKGESTGLGLDSLQLVPFVLSDVLGHQGVGRLDIGELTGHDSRVPFDCLVWSPH